MKKNKTFFISTIASVVSSILILLVVVYAWITLLNDNKIDGPSMEIDDSVKAECRLEYFNGESWEEVTTSFSLAYMVPGQKYYFRIEVISFEEHPILISIGTNAREYAFTDEVQYDEEMDELYVVREEKRFIIDKDFYNEKELDGNKIMVPKYPILAQIKVKVDKHNVDGEELTVIGNLSNLNEIFVTGISLQENETYTMYFDFCFESLGDDGRDNRFQFQLLKDISLIINVQGG